MNIDNSIELNYIKLYETDDINHEFEDLYSSVNNERLKIIFSTLHYHIITSLKAMNERLPTYDEPAHFWADPSRSLIKSIGIADSLERSLKNSKMSFTVNKYYREIFDLCNKFLVRSGGSTIPPNTEEIELYYTIPIFEKNDSIIIENQRNVSDLKIIGSGSYAQVFKYHDDFYNKDFAIKRAKSDLNEKEIKRFKREYDEMKSLNCPYVLEVFSYDEIRREYTMEFVDTSLNDYIIKNNTKLSFKEKKKIGFQIIKAFSYIHSKDMLHRDISPKNILLKLYDDIMVVKISDFGLVKLISSDLTSKNTDFKGYFNDRDLMDEGFDKYNILHETYALTRVLYFVITGRTKCNKIHENLKNFMNKGLSKNSDERFQNIDELSEEFKKIHPI